MANTLGTLLLQLKADSSAFVKGLSDAKDYAFSTSGEIVASIGKIGDQIGKLNFDNFKQAAKSFETLGTITAGVAVAVGTAVIAITEEVAKQAKEMDNLSQSTGVSVQTISQFRVAATLTGVSLEEITRGMERLAKNAATVAESTGGSSSKGAGAAFQALNVQATDANGKLRPMSDLLLDVAGKFSSMENGTTKTALAMQLFGRSGAALIPFLNEGREGVQKMMDLSDQLGLTWADKDVRAARAFAEQVELLNLKGTAFKEQIAKGLLPALDNLANSFVKADASGASFGKDLGSGIGTVITWISARFIDAAYSAGWFVLQLDQVLWRSQQVADVVVNGAKKFDEYEQAINGAAAAQAALTSQYAEQLNRLQAGSSPSALFGGSGGTGPVPALAAAAPGIGALVAQFERLSNATTSLLDKAGADKFQTQIDKIKEHIKALQDFASAHPEIIWESITEQVMKLKSALGDLVGEQERAFAASLRKDSVKEFGELFKGPASMPNISGVIEQQHELAKLSDDVNERNKEGASIYSSLQTASEKWAFELQKINILLEHGNITQETYNRLKREEWETINAAFDPYVRYQQQIDKLTDALKNNLLTERSRLEIEKQLAALQAAQNAQGVGGGIMAGLAQFSLQWKGWGQESMDATKKALSGMQNAFSTFFSSVIMGTKTLGQAFAQLGSQILSSIVGAIADMVAEWIVATIAAKIFQSATQSNNQSQAQSAAGLAGANMVASWSLAPWPIDAYAPAMGAVAFGAAEAFASLASAAGGMVVGQDQLAMVHKNEHILPARLAQTYEAASSSLSGGGGGGNSAPITVQYNVSAVDAASVRDFFRQHGNVLATEVQRQIRNRNLSASR